MAIAVLLLPGRAVFALALTVNSTADEPAADPTISTCISTPSGQCTLRAAIMVTNFFAGPHTITVPSGTFTLTRPGYDDGALVGDLDIAHDLTIQGAGSGVTIVDGNGSVTHDRVFQVRSSVQNITMSGMTIRNGESVASTVGVIGGGGLYIEGASTVHLNDVIVDGNSAQNGGGIYANFPATGGSLVLSHVVVRGNTVTAGGVGAGGGIFAHLPSSTSQVTMQDSEVYSNTADGTGGGLYVDGNSSTQWTVLRSQIYSNTAASGGAIGNFVPLTLTDSRLHDNHANFDGGAIEAFSPYIITRTTLATNSAGRFGGGIFDLQNANIGNAAFTQFAHIEQSTLSGNSAQYGGGIYHDAFITPSSTLMLLNSTVSGNVVFRRSGVTGTADGAGIFMYDGTLQLLNATVASNRVQLGFGLNVYPGNGGGLFTCIRDTTNTCTPATTVITALNSLIANNTRGNGITLDTADDCYSVGATGTLDFDLFGTMANCSITGPQTGNIVGQNPLLGALQANGGPTQTHALLSGSPAINAGAATGCTKDAAGVTPLTVDQRGAPRPYPVASRCDIGAFEVGPLATLDVDASITATKYDALTDGLILIRYLFGLTGPALTSGALGATATRTDPVVIKAYLDSIRLSLDIDGNGTSDALTDGLLIIRYLFGLRGDSLIAGAIDPLASRRTAPDIETYIQSLMP